MIQSLSVQGDLSRQSSTSFGQLGCIHYNYNWVGVWWMTSLKSSGWNWISLPLGRMTSSELDSTDTVWSFQLTQIEVVVNQDGITYLQHNCKVSLFEPNKYECYCFASSSPSCLTLEHHSSWLAGDVQHLNSVAMPIITLVVHSHVFLWAWTETSWASGGKELWVLIIWSSERTTDHHH